jgi:CPA2 family monovalent cation:H+ antiporter-2
VTYISSSGIIARVLAELGRLKNPETPAVLSVLVLEDLACSRSRSGMERDSVNFAAHQAYEIILLTVLGTILLVARIAQRVQVSAAIGA